MPQVRFTGWVLPKALRVSVVPLDRFSWDAAELDLEASFSTTIRNAFVEIVCDLNRYEPGLVSELHKRALDLSRAAVDLVSFATGYGLVVVLDGFAGPDGRRTPLAVHNPELAPLCTAFRLKTTVDAGFAEMCRLVMSDPGLFMALNDLIAAITYPHQAAVNCARAVESIRNHITPPADPPPAKPREQREERDKAWERMRQALRVDETYLRDVTNTSLGPRHGNRKAIPGTQITAVVEKSWRIMDRFLEYRKRGNKDLPATDDFPTLTGP